MHDPTAGDRQPVTNQGEPTGLMQPLIPANPLCHTIGLYSMCLIYAIGLMQPLVLYAIGLMQPVVFHAKHPIGPMHLPTNSGRT